MNYEQMSNAELVAAVNRPDSASARMELFRRSYGAPKREPGAARDTGSSDIRKSATRALLEPKSVNGPDRERVRMELLRRILLRRFGG